MDNKELKFIIAQGEGQFIEFKESFSQKDGAIIFPIVSKISRGTNDERAVLRVDSNIHTYLPGDYLTNGYFSDQ